MQIKKLGIRLKVLGLVLFFSFSAISLAVVVSYIKSRNALVSMAEAQLASLKISSQSLITSTFHETQDFTALLGHDRLMEGLFIAYEGAFYGLGFQMGKDEKFAGKGLDELDKKYSAKYDSLLDAFNLGNVLLVNINGQVIFSAKRNHDFLGRSLTKGELQGNNLHQCYEKAMSKEIAAGTVIFEDFKFNEVFKKTFGYFCVKSISEFDHLSEGIKKGDTLGVVAVEINIDRINKLLGRREGLGEFGQVYLVGQDNLLRSNFFLENETYNIDNVFAKGIKVESPSIQKALIEKQDGIIHGDGPLGFEVVSAFGPIEIMGNHWALVSDMKMDEVVAPARGLLIFVVISSLVLFILMTIVAIPLVKKMVIPLEEAADTLSQVSTHLSKDSQAMSESSDTLKDASNEQKSHLTEIVAAVDEISATVAGNSRNAEESQAAAETSLSQVQNGKSVIEQMLLSMNEIDNSNVQLITEIESGNSKLKEIVKMINEIGEKTKIINDIVFQTRLLSFNASVEAARAGEHGKGFSVVAEEIGNLAAMSGASAAEITQLLDQSVGRVTQILGETQETVQKFAQIGKGKVAEGTNVAKECADVFDQILVNFERVSQMVGEISRASVEQNKGMEEIGKAMALLNTNTDNTNTIAVETNQVATRLSEQGDTLKQVVDRMVITLRGSSEEES